jgi:hypothetical protein
VPRQQTPIEPLTQYGYNAGRMIFLGCLKWAAVGFIVAFFLMFVFEATRIHDDIPVPEFKRKHASRVALALSTFAGVLSGLVWLLVQRMD